MNQPRLNPKGFALVGILLVVIILTAIGGTGVYIYNKHQKTQSTTNTSTTKNGNSASNKGGAAGSKQSSTPTQQVYLVVKEWGVKLPLSDSVKDAYYVASTSTKDSNGQPNTMWLGLTSLNSKGCNAALANQGEDTQLGALLRVSPTESDPVSGETYKQLYPGGVTIGNYYYTYQSWTKGKTCASQSQLQTINTAFSNATKGTVAN